MRRAVEDGAELRAAGLLDQAAVEQRGGGRVGADAADAGDLRARDRLQVGDDRERLGLRGRERRERAARLSSAPRRVLGVGSLASVQPPAELAQRGSRARPGAYCSASSSSAARTASSLGAAWPRPAPPALSGLGARGTAAPRSCARGRPRRTLGSLTRDRRVARARPSARLAPRLARIRRRASCGAHDRDLAEALACSQSASPRL